MTREPPELGRERFLRNATERIPIMIRLEELAVEQSLEGLLGKHFTSVSVTPRYVFDLFMELNLRGRFVIFLDGFDEMAHAMSFERLRYNFQRKE